MARILIADDNADTRMALAVTLEYAGHEVLEVEDGDEVLDIVVSEKPELVVLDVMMPRVGGFDALAALKSDPRTWLVPVIIVTARRKPEDIDMARSLGAAGYIIKPRAMADVEARVNWVLASAETD